MRNFLVMSCVAGPFLGVINPVVADNLSSGQTLYGPEVRISLPSTLSWKLPENSGIPLDSNGSPTFKEKQLADLTVVNSQMHISENCYKHSDVYLAFPVETSLKNGEAQLKCSIGHKKLWLGLRCDIHSAIGKNVIAILRYAKSACEKADLDKLTISVKSIEVHK